MKRFYPLFFCLACILLSFSNSVFNNPCDSPNVGGHTGAPGETGCNGCHAGTANTGPAIIDFTLGTTTYVPGQTYMGYVRIQQPGMQKFGFVCLALRNSNLTTVGTFTNINGFRTRTFADGNRNYVGHTPCGADSVDANRWTFNWTAPMSGTDTITLYLGTLAANHDHALTGDYGYEQQLVLYPQLTGVNELQNQTEVQVYPNPFDQKLFIQLHTTTSPQISIFNLEGSCVINQVPLKLEDGAFEISGFTDLNSGVYVLKIDTGKEIIFKKVIRY